MTMDVLHNVPSLDAITHRDLRKTSTTHGMPMPGDDLSKPRGWSKGEYVAPAREVVGNPLTVAATASYGLDSSSIRLAREGIASGDVRKASTAPSTLVASRASFDISGDQIQPRPSVYSGIEPASDFKEQVPTVAVVRRSEMPKQSVEAPTFLDPFAPDIKIKLVSAISRFGPPPRQKGSSASSAGSEGRTSAPYTSRPAVTGSVTHTFPQHTFHSSGPAPPHPEITSGMVSHTQPPQRARNLRIDSQPEIQIIAGNTKQTMTGALLSREQSVRLVLLLSAMAVILSLAGRFGGGEASGRSTLALAMVGLAVYIVYESIIDRRAEAALKASLPRRKRPVKGLAPSKSAQKGQSMPKALVPLDQQEKVAGLDRIEEDITRARLGSIEGITERTMSKDQRIAALLVEVRITSSEMDETYRPLFFAELRDPWGKSVAERTDAHEKRLVQRGRAIPPTYQAVCEAVVDCARQCFVDSLLDRRGGAYLNGQTIRLGYDTTISILEVSVFLWEDQGHVDGGRSAWYRALGSLQRILKMMTQGSLPGVPPGEVAVELVFRPSSTGSMTPAERIRFSQVGKETGLSTEVVRAISTPHTKAFRRVRWIADMLNVGRVRRVTVSYKPHRGWQRLKAEGEAWTPEEWSRIVPSAFAALAEAGKMHFTGQNPLDVLEVVDHLPMRWKPGEEAMGAFAFADWSWKTLLIGTAAGNLSTNAELFGRIIQGESGVLQHFRRLPNESHPPARFVLSGKSTESVHPFTEALSTMSESTEKDLTELSTLLNSDLVKCKNQSTQRDLFIQRAALKDRLEGLKDMRQSSWWIAETDGTEREARKIWPTE